MNYFKKLACPDYATINQQVLDYIYSMPVVDSMTFWNPISAVDFVKATPLLQSWLAQQQLHIKALAVTVGRNTDCCGPHTDTPPAKIKLSWPVLNTANTHNRWYQPVVEQCMNRINEYGGFLYLNRSELEQVAQMTLDSPALIRTNVPHDVGFEGPAVFPRIGLQCQLFKEPESL